MNKVTSTLIVLKIPYDLSNNSVEDRMLITQKKYEGFVPLPTGTILERTIHNFLCVTTEENELSDNRFIIRAGIKPLGNAEKPLFYPGELTKIKETFTLRGWTNPRDINAKEEII